MTVYSLFIENFVIQKTNVYLERKEQGGASGRGEKLKQHMCEMTQMPAGSPLLCMFT